MPKKPRDRTLMDSQHVKGSGRLLKSARQYFSNIFWSLWKQISSKDFVLVVSEILRHFVNILALDDKYSLSVKASVWPNQVKYIYLKFKKDFLSFLLQLPNLHKICNTFKKNMRLRGDFFLKL